jgi:hypothetical protein
LPKRSTTRKSSLVFSTWPARGSHWQSKATRTAKPPWSTKRRSHPSRSRNSNRSPGRNRPPRHHDELSRTPFPCWNYHSPDLRDTDLRFILSYDLGRLSWRPHLFGRKNLTNNFFSKPLAGAPLSPAQEQFKLRFQLFIAFFGKLARKGQRKGG